SNPADITYGTALSATQLNASTTPTGTFTYTPAAGTILNAGLGQTLSVDFTSSDANYKDVLGTTVTINVLQATPIINWSNPADITYGTALSATQLNASTTPTGTFTYTPPAGTILNIGSGQTLSVDFISSDANYTDVLGTTVTINVLAPAVVNISGNAGVSGATLSYDDGGLKTVTSIADGSYTLPVSYNWSGTVTPTKSGYTFVPASMTYTNVTVDQINQDYVARTERARNGGFNVYVAPSRIPRFWTAANFAATDGKDTLVKAEGAASVKITGAAGKVKTLVQVLPLSGASGDNFTFSFFVRGASVPVPGLCRIQVFLYNNTTQVTTKAINCPVATYNFQRKVTSFTATGAYNRVIVRLVYTKSSGTVRFDGFSLIR
ncbi:MAG: hypothetical protein PHQ36_05025, partial [Anaerolineales bacterium]|nr:hypothetical protein [Anaerolineales bacterium]